MKARRIWPFDARRKARNLSVRGRGFSDSRFFQKNAAWFHSVGCVGGIRPGCKKNFLGVPVPGGDCRLERRWFFENGWGSLWAITENTEKLQFWINFCNLHIYVETAPITDITEITENKTYTLICFWQQISVIGLGSSGPKGRRFKSCHLDQLGKSWNVWVSRLFCFFVGDMTLFYSNSGVLWRAMFQSALFVILQTLVL